MNQSLLTFLALSFGLLVIVQAAIGGWLFVHNIGFTADAVLAYYTDKSFHGVLEVLAPHTLMIAALLMALLHFLGFIGTLPEKKKKMAVHTLFSLFFLDQFSPLPILWGLEWFSYLKLIAFAGFELTLAGVWFWMFRATLREIR